MDNRLTKKRLSDYLSYEWILILIVIIAVIVLWELVYSVSAVRLTSGQQFKYYYDENVVAGSDGGLYELIIGEDGKKTFSYDVLDVNTEQLSSKYNVLSVRLSVYEGDAIFTDATEDEKGASRFKTVVDGNPVYTYDNLFKDGINYLSTFLKGEFSDLSYEERVKLVYDYNNLDESKIEARFFERMKGDNRFRSEEQKKEGKNLEKGRIKNLCLEMKKFGYLLEVGEEKGLFERYTKFEQSLAVAEERDKENYQKAVDREKEEGRGNAVYGLKADKLTGGKSVSEYLRILGKDTAEGVTLVLFDFYNVPAAKLYDLQFETVSFVNKIVEEFSDIYSVFN